MSIGRFVCVFIYVGLLFTTSAYALENCVTPPTCDELGFTVNIEDCAGAALKCPWDLSKAACRIKSAETVKPVSCVIGSVLGGDQLCYEAGQLPGNVTPIGIVFDTANKLAVALTDIKEDGSSGSETMYWSSSYCDVPGLTNCVYDSGDTAVDSCGVDGRANTTAILGCGSSCGTTYVANGTNLYNPSGCTADFCKKTKWFLPSMRDLAKIYANKTVINGSLTLLSIFGAKTLTESYYWSSTEKTADDAWIFGMYNGLRRHTSKGSNGLYVRPVVKY